MSTRALPHWQIWRYLAASISGDDVSTDGVRPPAYIAAVWCATHTVLACCLHTQPLCHYYYYLLPLARCTVAILRSPRVLCLRGFTELYIAPLSLSLSLCEILCWWCPHWPVSPLDTGRWRPALLLVLARWQPDSLGHVLQIHLVLGSSRCWL